MSFDRPEQFRVFNAISWAIALGLHLALVLAFWLYGVFAGLFHKEEPIIPIDLTVVVNENLNGVENEPPPLQKPEPPPPKPKPQPKQPKPVVKEPEKPKELEKIVTNIVTKVDKKAAEKDKKEEPKKPEPPKKTAKELREERIRKMRASATTVNKPVTIEVKNMPSGNGRTERQTRSPEEIRRLLDQGYRPGTKTQLATSVKQRCMMLIQRALNEKWDRMAPNVGSAGLVELSVQFNSNGGMINVRLARSCGDKVSDAAALSVARSVSYIQGLDAEFIAGFRNAPLTIRYTVRGK